MRKFEWPICKKCGYMLEETDNGYIVINPQIDKGRPLLQSSLTIPTHISFVYHKDICDGGEIVMLDPVAILAEHNMLLDTGG